MATKGNPDKLQPIEHAALAKHHAKMASHHMKMAGGGLAMDANIKRGEKKEPHGEHSVQERGYTRGTGAKMSGTTTGLKKGGAVRRK